MLFSHLVRAAKRSPKGSRLTPFGGMQKLKDVYLKLEAKYRDPTMLFHRLTDEANEKLGKTESIAIHRILRPHISIDSDSESLEAMQTEASCSTMVTQPIPIVEDIDQEDDDILKLTDIGTDDDIPGGADDDILGGADDDILGGAAPAFSLERSLKKWWKMRKIKNNKIAKKHIKPMSRFPVGKCGTSRVWLGGDPPQVDEDTLRERIAESGAEGDDAA